MLYSALAFLAGVCSFQALSALPGAAGYGLAALLPAVASQRRWLRVAGLGAAGFLWCWWHAAERLALELPAELAGGDLLVQGVVQGLPEGGASQRLRFRFQLERYRVHDGWRELRLPARISWYRDAPELRPGERWQLSLRLKKPRGLANPAGFDYERWLFAHGIRATGYVRGGGDNRRLPGEPAGWITRARGYLAERIVTGAGSADSAGLLAALGVGERSGMDAAQWEVLRNTGTSHLMAISGLHVGLVATLVFVAVRRGWGRWGDAQRWPAPAVAAASAMVAALVYALLAGFQVPAQRALIMVWLWMLSLLWSGKPDPWGVWGAALWVVLLLNPLSVLMAGFWLSFGAVAWILYLGLGRYGRVSRWRRVLGLQMALVLGLTPLMWLWFHQVSVIAPLANLVAIPWISLLVVPTLLLALVALPLVAPLGELLLRVAEQLLGVLWWWLEWLASFPAVLVPLPLLPAQVVALFAVGLLCVLAPKGLPLRLVGLSLMLPAVALQPGRANQGDLWLTLLDVGQGLAAVLETRGHVLVYDAGPAFANGLDSGETVVVPYLQQRGYRRVDRLLISHADNDHLGGGEAVFRRLDVQQVQSGEPGAITWARSTRCRAGQQWEWDGVRFEYLAPLRSGSGNNASCVLRIETADGRTVLLPGDIERRVENHLVGSQSQRLAAQVLVAPHHGSRTSSTPGFVQAVDPDIVLFAVGYRNRFGLPRPAVLQRYLRGGATVLDTAQSGAIQLRLVAGRGVQVVPFRDRVRRYWQ
jgi:competence protein ComEC